MKEIDVIDALSKFKPENFVFVISKDNKKASGMIAAWNMRCSWTPALYAVSLSKAGYTHKLIQKSKEFVVAVPNKALEETVLFFGSKSGSEVDKFKETKVKIVSGKKVKVPLLKDATFNFECKLIQTIDTGDHFTFIGEVVVAHFNEGKGILLNYGKKNGKRHFKEMPLEL